MVMLESLLHLSALTSLSARNIVVDFCVSTATPPNKKPPEGGYNLQSSSYTNVRFARLNVGGSIFWLIPFAANAVATSSI